jgi:hypothetical protein
MPESMEFLSFDFFCNCPEKQVVGFTWFGYSLASVNKKMEDECHHHYPSPIIFTPIIFEESHHFVNPGVKERCFSFCHGFVKLCNGFAYGVGRYTQEEDRLLLSRQVLVQLRHCSEYKSRSSKGSYCPDTFRCSSGPCGVDTSRCFTGLCSVDLFI